MQPCSSGNTNTHTHTHHTKSCSGTAAVQTISSFQLSAGKAPDWLRRCHDVMAECYKDSDRQPGSHIRRNTAQERGEGEVERGRGRVRERHIQIERSREKEAKANWIYNGNLTQSI